MLVAKANSGVNADVREGVGSSASRAAWDALEAAIGEFKQFAGYADRICTETGMVPDDVACEAQRRFDRVVHEMHVQIGNPTLTPRVRQDLGLWLQRVLLPLLRCGDIVERCCSKPRGYPGDFEVIDRLYLNQPRGTGRIGALVDRCFLNTVPARIVRGRRALFAQELAKTVAESPGVTRVCVIACGPAGEVFDAFELIAHPERLQVALIDADPDALAFVDGKSRSMGLEGQISLLNANPALIALGRTRLPLAQQDLVYSLGLTDYFSDKLAIKLLNAMHGMLREGGRAIVGNYHPVNPARELMEILLDWRLIYRTEEEMDRLYRQSAFGTSCTRIQFEGQGVDMFAECRK